MLDPWAELSRHPHVAVHHTRLRQASAVTDGHATIWLDERLTEVEERCALTHELVHLELGHAGHQPEAVEAKVRERTARLLVPAERLWAVRHWQGRLYELAEELDVTVAVLRDRLRWLTEDEQLVREMICRETGEC